jgi:tripeptide aminopeptidase
MRADFRSGRRLVPGLLCLLGLALAPAAGRAAETPEAARARRVVDSPRFQAAVAEFDRDFDRFVRELIFLTEIPAPPFKEQLRAEAYAKLCREVGLADVTIDTEGNVLGLWRGRPGGAAPLLAVAAHLDTVFPEGTEVKVKRQGSRLLAPGIGDDTRGLAFLLAAIRALRAAKIETPGDILFIGNVGEEGPGDLRGMRYLFGQGPWRERIRRFITIDGSNNDLVTNSALGSKRYRVTFKGPGGHSWGAFGQVSPAFAMGNAVAALGGWWRRGSRGSPIMWASSAAARR